MFLATYRSVFPRGLPTKRPVSRMLTFDSSWCSVELPNVDMDILKTLEPFLMSVRNNPMTSRAIVARRL
jgi:hypothetical protein